MSKKQSRTKLVVLVVLVIIAMIISYRNNLFGYLLGGVFELANTTTSGGPNGGYRATATNIQKNSKQPIVGVAVEKKINTASEYIEIFFKSEFPKLENCTSQSIGSWENAEIKRHEKLLDDLKVNLIVLPVQEIDPVNDRVGRLMSARMVAHEIELQTNKKVLSPELTQRLLGSHQIIFDQKRINSLATKLGAEVVYLLKRKKKDESLRQETPPRNNKEAELSVLLADSNGVIKKQLMFDIGPEDIRMLREYRKDFDYKKALEEPPETLELRIGEICRTIVEQLFTVPITKNKAIATHHPTSWIIPERISDIPNIARSPLDHAAYFQLLALLTPEILSYERERLFERSLLALRDLDQASDGYNLLYTRAMFYLSRRPFGIKYLENAKSPAELALLAYLNGNITGMSELVNRIDNPLLHSLALIELRQLQFNYKKIGQNNERFMVPNSGWVNLIDSAAQDKDTWNATDNLDFFSKLQGIYPDFDTHFAETSNGNAIIGELYKSDTSIKIISDLFMLPDGLQSFEHDQKYNEMVSIADIWNLYRNLSIANILKKLQLTSNVQCSYDTALNVSKSIEGIMGGNPVYSYLHAYSLAGKANELSGSERQTYLGKAYGLAEEVFQNTCGVSQYTVATEYLIDQKLKSAVPDTKKYFPVPRSFVGVIDHGYYPTSYLQPDWSSVFLVFPFTNTRIEAIYNVAEKLGDAYVETKISNRFLGHPGKTSFLAQRAFQRKDDQTGVDILYQAIRDGDDTWNTLQYLDFKLLEKRRYQEAKEVMLNYPPFKNPRNGENRVAISNNAYWTGEQFIKVGHYEEAKPFFQIASSLGTGAGSQFRSMRHLAVLAQDYPKALEAAYSEARRYQNPEVYNDYLTLLHVTGQHENADAAFKVLSRKDGSNQLWTSQLIGNRIRGYQVEDIINSLKSNHSLPNQTSIVLNHIAQNIILDRLPSKSELSQLKVIEDGKIIIRPLDYQQKEINSILVEKSKQIFPEVTLDGEQSSFGSYGIFTDLFLKYTLGEYQRLLATILSFYRAHETSDDPMIMFMLPYLTIATCESGSEKQVMELETLLTKLEEKNYYRQFDISLSWAVIHAFHGRSDEALESLAKSFTDYSLLTRNNESRTKWMEHETYRPLVRTYHAIQISEFLNKKYHDNRYIDQALDWAKRTQKIAPQHSWAYAFEALYGTDHKEKIKAAAFAQYLDSNSYWLSKVKKNLLKEARLWWGSNNPFTIKDEDRDKDDNKRDV